MPSRIVIRGQTTYSTRGWDAARPARQVIPKNRAGEIISLEPIPPRSPDSPFRAGVPFHDPDDDLTYRVLDYINVAEGWGTSTFWCRRWHCSFKQLMELARRGWLDAAIDGARTKRYRCRDEPRCMAWIAAQRAKAQQRKTDEGSGEDSSRFRRDVGRGRPRVR